MASQPANRDLELVLQRFFSLSPPEQLDAYRTIRDFLAERVRETKRDRVIAERAAAVQAMADVAAHLSLPAGEAPTPVQFDKAARSLALGWDRSRVRRAWGRWRFAKAAFLGQQPSRSTRPRGRWRQHSREGHLTGVKLWLATKPERVTSAAYRDWARQYNEKVPTGELAVSTSAAHIGGLLQATWPDVVRLARGEISQAEARRPNKRRRERFCRGPHQLVSFEDVRTILRQPSRGASIESRQADFPAPVIVLPNTRLWLRDDIKAYKAGRRWSSEENAQQLDSLRGIYLTVDEVKKLTGLNRDQLKLSRTGVPRPAVKVGFRLLWLRSEVEASPAVKRGQSG